MSDLWDNRTEYEWNEIRREYIKTLSPEMKIKDYCLLTILIILVIILAFLPPL